MKYVPLSICHSYCKWSFVCKQAGWLAVSVNLMIEWIDMRRKKNVFFWFHDESQKSRHSLILCICSLPFKQCGARSRAANVIQRCKHFRIAIRHAPKLSVRAFYKCWQNTLQAHDSTAELQYLTTYLRLLVNSLILPPKCLQALQTGVASSKFKSCLSISSVLQFPAAQWHNFTSETCLQKEMKKPSEFSLESMASWERYLWKMATPSWNTSLHIQPKKLSVLSMVSLQT